MGKQVVEDYPEKTIESGKIEERLALAVRQKHYRTWTVVLAGLCSLLVMMILLGALTLRKSDALHSELRRAQDQYEVRQRQLHGLARNMFLVSVTIREFLLDTSAENNRQYLQRFTQLQMDMEKLIRDLRTDAQPPYSIVFDQLETELAAYRVSVSPVFNWTVQQRVERGTYFLRQEQRPRRQSILQIADQISRLNTSFYRQQTERINASQQAFRRDVNAGLQVAVLIGLAIAAASIGRILWLERREQEQRHLAERSGEQLRALSAQLRNAQEAERKAIARELHDEVGQKLTAVSLGLGTFERLRAAGEQEFREHLHDVKDLAEQSLRAIREISAGLRPSVLDDLGLGPALQHQARQFTRHTGTPVSVEITGDVSNLTDRHRISLYRIVQESLTNCAKHARANNVWVKVEADETRLRLDVEDDGVGFERGAELNGGTGIVGIRERVRELGGSLKIDSRPQHGTRIEVLVGRNEIAL